MRQPEPGALVAALAAALVVAGPIAGRGRWPRLLAASYHKTRALDLEKGLESLGIVIGLSQFLSLS